MGIRDRRFARPSSSSSMLSTSSSSSSTTTTVIPTSASSPPPMEAIIVKKFSDSRSRRPTISGFLPLPPISASPICTPTTSSSSRDISFYSDSTDDKGCSNESYATAPTSPSESSLSPYNVPAPTWISIPPTPPPLKVIKRSVTCIPRRLPSSVTSSTSFPASMSPRGGPQSKLLLQRCASTSSIPNRARARSASESTMHFPTSPLRSTHVSAESIPVLVAHSRQPLSDVTVTRSQQPTVVIDHHDNDQEDSLKDCSPSEESHSSVEGGDTLSRQKKKDSHRKYHALLELLSTEVAYLKDLRVLVSVYLRNIPTLTRHSSTGTFSRNSSFSALSRNSSFTHLATGMSGAGSSGMDLHVHGLQPLTSTQPNARPSRHLFTDMEVDILTQELSMSMNILGIPMESAGADDTSLDEVSKPGIKNVEAGIVAVSTKFATESSRFNIYQAFCAGHPDALDILRRVQQLYPTEWEAFEQRCGVSASEPRSDSEQQHAVSTKISSPTENLDMEATATVPKRRRRGSLSAVDHTVRTIRARIPNQISRELAAFDPTKRPRLFFMDYLIKPVQRICKYPLLLDQLKSGSALRSEPSVSVPDVSVVVGSAALAMRHVAGAVDEARRRQDVAARSSLIVSRTSVSVITTSMSSQPLQNLTSSFLSSLGTCMFAGSLDVIHSRHTKHSANMTSVNVKYLGAFLYAGGYMVLVKVLKGKMYEPRHWFRLSEFQISDPEEIEAWLPSSFRLSRKGYEFELAAACQAEKDAWMSVIRESMVTPAPTWINEPSPSFNLDKHMKEVAPSTLDDGPFEMINTLPTIQSISELSKNDHAEIVTSPVEQGTHEEEVSTPTRSPNPHPHPSRHSSSASMRSILSPLEVDSDTIIIRRCLPSARGQVDLGLQDVISDQCVAARSHAAVHEGGLFHAPHISRSGTSRSSSSALSMKKLKRHESVRVARRSYYEPDNKDAPKSTYGSRTKSLSRASFKRPKTLSITSNSSDGFDFLNSPNQYQSPPYSSYSLNFSLTSSAPTSTDTSPVLDIPFPTSQRRLSTASTPGERPKRPQRNSIYGSVRNLLTRTPDPQSREPSPSKQPIPSSNLFKRWVKTTHRRANSAPSTTDAEPLRYSNSPVLPELGLVGPQLHWPASPGTSPVKTTS